MRFPEPASRLLTRPAAQQPFIHSPKSASSAHLTRSGPGCSAAACSLAGTRHAAMPAGQHREGRGGRRRWLVGWLTGRLEDGPAEKKMFAGHLCVNASCLQSGWPLCAHQQGHTCACVAHSCPQESVPDGGSPPIRLPAPVAAACPAQERWPHRTQLSRRCINRERAGAASSISLNCCSRNQAAVLRVQEHTLAARRGSPPPCALSSAKQCAPVARRPQVVVGFQEHETEPLDGVKAHQRVQPDLQGQPKEDIRLLLP